MANTSVPTNKPIVSSHLQVFVGGLVFDLGRVNCGLGYRSLPSIVSDDPRSSGAAVAVLTTVAVVLLAVFIVLFAVCVASHARRTRRWPFAKKRSCHMEPNVLYVAGTTASPTAEPTGNQPALSEGTAVTPSTRVAPSSGRNCKCSLETTVVNNRFWLILTK